MAASPGHVSLHDRPRVLTPRPAARASVAFPVFESPRWGVCTAATVRSSVNGHSGGRMSHAGDVVLFGGSDEAGESPGQAALRELGEESGTLDRLAGFMAAAARLTLLDA